MGTVEARTIVDGDLKELRAYVEKVANATPDQALSIIQSAGMSVRKVPVQNKGELNVKPDRISGSVKVSAKVGVPGHEAHEWQYSLDQETWTSAPSTLQAKMIMAGFTPGVIVYFRHRAITKAGLGNWRQTVSTMVV